MSENEQSARRRKRPWRQPRQPVGGGSGLVMAGREVSQAVAEGEGGAKEKGCASEGDAMTRRMDEGREAEEGMGEGDTGKNGTDEGDASSSVGGAQASNSVRAEGQKGKEKARVVKGKKRKARSSLEGQGDGGRRERSELQNELQTNGGLEVGVASADVVEIDGSVMEGGGQILRNAATLSVLLRRPIRVTRIRAGRSNAGLRPQHLAGLHLIGQLCGGKLAGDSVHSTEVELCPGAVRNGRYTADTQTAGSTCLLLQVSLPCLLFAPLSSSSSSSPPTTLTLRGGTNTDMAPPIDYIQKVFKPVATKFGVEFECNILKRGFYPRGGGELLVKPHPLRHLTAATITDPGQVTHVSVHCYIAGTVPERVSRDMSQAARQQLERQLPGVAVTMDTVKETAGSACGNGSGIIVVAETSTGCLFGGSAIGKRDDPPYKTGRAATDEVLRAIRSGGCVDEHLQDQLIILMALAKGRSALRTGPISLHTKTAIHVARSLTSAVFHIRKLEGEAHLIECDGIGLENTSKDRLN